MELRSFAAGEVICREDDACDTAFLVNSGEIELKEGTLLRMIGKGEMFGDFALLKRRPHVQTATAKQAGSLTLLSPSELEDRLLQLRETALAENSALQGMTQVMENLARMTKLLSDRCDHLERTIQHPVVPAAPVMAEVADNEKSYLELTHELAAHLSNLGPLMPLLEDESINDILINGPKDIFIERAGMLVKTDVTFPDDTEVLRIAEKIVKAVGRRLDPNRPLVDARLLDGSRVNIIAPPLAVDGTSISIRKFSKKKITLEVMCEKKNTSFGLSEFLKIVGRCRVNVLISGGTGSGKTTLLNAISQYIDPSERIVTIEDAAELQLLQPHVVRLETKPRYPGMGPEEEVSMRDLVKNSLRMRPDRIIVGEVRGPEAFDMMQAMNTGHEGSLTTVHANHPRDALSRVENMISMADLQIPMKSLRYQIAQALHLIIQISRMRDGHRRVTFVSEVVGMEGDMITMHDLFTFVPEGEDKEGKIQGSFKWSGIMPRFARRIAYYGESARLEAAFGVKLPKNIQ